jgi:hypothetical protein
VTRWQRYWFADGGRIAVAVLRIAIASSVLIALWRISGGTSLEAAGDAGLYRPVGIWMLLGHTPPPGPVVDVLWITAWLSTAAMLVGFLTRIATAVSFGSSVALASLVFAGSATWSHQYNVVFLAHCAFLGARGGDALSVDAWLRSRRKLPPVDVPRGYQWSLRLVQLAVALMFAGAAFHKVMHGHFTLRWALSDSLRNHLLVKYDLAGIPRPPIVDWIIDDPWKYRTVAVLNLISQLAPIFACIFVRRPLVRLIAGAFFIVETIALDQVVSLWNPHWLPLAAAFVDWDAAVARFAPRWSRPPPDATSWSRPRAISIFIIGFVAYDAFTALVPGVDQRLNTYPFSGFPMFATIRAKSPYDEHVPYAIVGDKFEVFADHPVHDHAQRWFDHANRGLHAVRDPVRLRAKLAAMVDEAKRRYPEVGVHGVRAWVTIFIAPPVPEPGHFEPHPIAILGEYRADGTFETALGKLADGTVELSPRGLDGRDATLVYFKDDEPIAIPIAAPRTGDRFAVGELAGDPIYVAAVIAGSAWLVASHEDWHWN